jgi:hypothetical protein
MCPATYNVPAPGGSAPRPTCCIEDANTVVACQDALGRGGQVQALQGEGGIPWHNSVQTSAPALNTA